MFFLTFLILSEQESSSEGDFLPRCVNMLRYTACTHALAHCSGVQMTDCIPILLFAVFLPLSRRL